MAHDSDKPSENPDLDELSPGHGPVSIPDHQLLRRIGRGSYGEVWLARNMMGMYRAVKIVYRKWFEDARPFERELSGIRKYEPISRSFEGFVDVLHVGINEAGGYFYYVMELGDDQVAGQSFDPALYFPQTLAKVLSQRGRLPLQECLQLGLALSQALAELHKHGLVHRDVKPSNVIFVNGVPKLADIGLVAPADEARSYVGTEGFIPPEGPGSAQADIYGLGKLLYECCTGKDRQDFPELPTILDQFSDTEKLLELNEVILHACKNEANQRYRSAWDMHADLVVLANGKSVKRLKVLERRLSVLKRIVSVSGIAVLAGAFVAYNIFRERRIKLDEVQRQVGANIAYGRGAMERGNLLEALPYFGEAMRLDQGTQAAKEDHRQRYGATLAQCPKLNQMWFTGIRVNDAEFSPDGNHLLIVNYFEKARIYDLRTGAICGQPFGRSPKLRSGTYSPDGQLLATANSDNTARIVNATTLEEKYLLPHSNKVYGVRFHPDGLHVLTSCVDGFARVWDLATCQVVLSLKHGAAVWSSDYSPDGRLIVTGGEDYVARIWSTNGATIGKPLQHGAWVVSVSFSHDGQKLATGSHDHTVKVWTVQTGEQIQPDLVHAGVVNSVEFSPDDRLILTACTDGNARLWSSSSLQLLGSNPVLKHAEPLFRAAFSPDGHRFVTACLDGTVRVWDLAGSNWQPVPVPWVYNREATRFIVSASNSFQVYDAISNAPVSPAVCPEWPVSKMQLNRTGSFVTTMSLKPEEQGGTNCSLQIWDGMTGDKIGKAFVMNSNAWHRLSDDGKRLVIYTGISATSYEVLSGEAHPLVLSTKTKEPIGAIFQSRDGQTIAARIGSEVHVWNSVDGRLLYPPLVHIVPVEHVEFSPDGTRILTCCADGLYTKCYAQVWNASTGQAVGPRLKHNDGVMFAAFSPDGHRVVTAGEDARAIVWETETGRQLTPPLQHEKLIRSAVFSPDGKWIVTASSDRTARVWSSETGEPLTPPLRHLNKLVSATFMADGRHILTLDEPGKRRVWKLPLDGRPVEELISLATLLSGSSVAPMGQLAPPQSEALESVWHRLRAKHPDTFETAREEVITWHAFQAEESEMKPDWRAAAFHLKKLLEITPDDESVLKRLKRAQTEITRLSSAAP